MLVLLFSFAQRSNCILNSFGRLHVGIFGLFLAYFQGFSNSQNGDMEEVYSVDWNGSDFLLSGNGVSNSPFPTLSLFENNYYVFNNVSGVDVRFSIGEDNSSEYTKLDVWNNGSFSNDEYLLFSPDLNSSRTIYYFKPDQNQSVGQINISSHDSQILYPQLNVNSLKFGQSIAINDWNQTIIGSPGAATFDDGAFHIFNRETNGTYSYFEKILPPTSGQIGQFGHDLEVENEFLFVSSPDSSSYSGSVDIFKRESNGSYSFHQSLNTFASNYDSFGWDLSASGQYLAVSSLQAINNKSGKISIFENNGTNWGLVDLLHADDNQSNDEFGYAVDLNATRLLAGAPKADANGTNSGAAYIFEKNASGWYQSTKLSPTGLSAGDEFGYSVALKNDLAFVGARKKDGNATNAGAVYVFRMNGSNWEEISVIYPPQNLSNQYFASDLKINADILAVTSNRQGQGYTYLYRVEDNGTSNSLISSLNLSDANSTDQNFLSIALADGTAIIGIPGDSTNVNVGGGALAFYNDAWQFKALPRLAPIIEHNSSINHTIAEDSGTYIYDFNGSHPHDSNLTWNLSLSPDANASFDLNSTTGNFTYTPDGNYSGIHSFRATLSNGNDTDTIDFNVTVTPVQDAPVFLTSSIALGMEGDDYNQSILIFDADGDNLILNYISPSLGLRREGFDIVGAPNLGSANGQAFQDYNVTLSADDSNGNTTQKQFSFRVLKRNNPPLIWVDGNSSFSVLPDIILNEDFNATTWFAALPGLDYNDSDGHQIELNASVTPLHGSLVLDINGSDTNQSILYIPDGNFSGTDSFTIRLTDLNGEGNKSAELIFNIIINPINDSPQIISVPPSTSIQEGNFFNYPILISDPDNNDTLVVSLQNLPSSGWLSFNQNSRVLSGTPSWSDYEENGSRLIVINVSDSAGLQDAQAFNLEVIPNNYPPSIAEGSTYSISVNEDSMISNWGNLNLTTTERDSTVGILSWAISTNPANGTAIVSGTGNSPGSLSYMPDGNFSGNDSFVLTVYDSGDINASDSILININVSPQEDDPFFKSVTSGIAVKDNLFDYQILVFDADLDANITISSLVPLPSWATLVDDGNGSARLSGTPDQYDLGSNLIVLQGRDQTNRFAIQAFMLVVLGENTNPIISQGSEITFTLTEDVLWQGHHLISASDIDGQTLTWSVLNQPTHGSLQISGQGISPTSLDYMPDANYSGNDFFQLNVSDGIGSDQISVNLNIQNVNDSPVFSSFPNNQTTIDNQVFQTNMVVFDADGLIGSVVELNASNWLSVQSINYTSGALILSGTPQVSDEGNSTVVLKITDSTGLSVSSSFNLEVIVLNYPPIINNGVTSLNVTMVEDNATTWIAPNLSASDIETNSTDLVWSILSNPQNGTVSIDSNGQNLAYISDSNYSGSDFFEVLVTDTGGLSSSPPKSDSLRINVEIEPVNDPPVFISVPTSDVNGSYSWNDESVYVYKVKTYDSDWNYDWHSLDLNVSGTLPNWMTFVDDGNGTGQLYGLATVEEEGNYTISFEAFDSNQTSVVQTFNLEIRIDNYPPVFRSVSDSNKTISELVVYIDEDTNLNSLERGWIAPFDYKAIDPDPALSPTQTLTWTLGGISQSGAQVLVDGTGERPTNFSYTPFQHFFGEEIIQLMVNDGNRSSVLPVRVRVRGLPDAPVFNTSFDTILVAKEGAQFSLDISTYDPDNSLRTIKVFGLPSGGDSWLKLVEQNSTTGSARLFGVPPSQSSGDRYQLAFVVTDETGLFSVANCQLIVDGKNLSPVINIGSKATVRFDSTGKAKQSDIARLYATDIEGGRLQWSLSPSSFPSYGTATVLGSNSSIPSIKYLPYSSAQQDLFGIRVSDGVSYDEIEITAMIVDSFDTFDVSDPTINTISSGLTLIEHFKVSNISSNSVIEATLQEGPSWLKVEKVEFNLFKLHGIVPLNITGVVAIKISFSENEESNNVKQYNLNIVDSSPPKLSLKGDEFIQFRVGQIFTEPGYLSTDNDGSDLSGSVQIIGNVDVNQKGVTEIVYTSTDSSGNSSELKRTVQVVEHNESVRITNVIPITSGGLSALSILEKGDIILGHSSETEANFSKYQNYTELSNPLNSVKFQAQQVNIEQILVTKEGGFLVCGIFRGNLKFGENLVSANGNHNIFVLKLDQNFKLVWFKTISCSSILEKIYLMETLDQSIQIAGNFHGQLQLDSQTWNSQGGTDNFIWNLKSSGEFAWLKTYGGKGIEEMVGIGGLPDGSFVAVSNSVKENISSYCTIVKFSKEGIVIGGKSLNNINFNRANEIVCKNKSIFLAGQFDSELVIDSQTIRSNSSSSGFVLSFNSEINLNWMFPLSSTGKTKAQQIEMDAFGYPLVALSYEGNLSLPNVAPTHPSLGLNDLMVIKINPLSGEIIWAQSIGTTGDDSPTEFEVGPCGTILLGSSFTTPFSLNEFSHFQGNQFLVKLESSLGSPSFESIANLNLQDNIFFDQEIKVLNQSFVRLKMLDSPTWMNLQDNLDGTGILGGLPSTKIASSGKVKIRAYNADGGVSDLDLNYSVSTNSNTILSKEKLPQFSTALNFGKEAIISSVNSSTDGEYYIAGTFSKSVKLGNNILTSQGQNDGFVGKFSLDGSIDRSIQLISKGELSISSTVMGTDGDIYIIGDFTDELQVGPFNIKSSGGYDLFVVHWSQDGALKNLTSIGGSSNEYFQHAFFYENSLLLSGQFDGTFSHGSYSIKSRGEKDGFIMEVPTIDVSKITWVQNFGGVQEDQVNGLAVSSDGKIFLAGSYQGSSIFGKISHQSAGLSDCFIGELDRQGTWKNVYSGGGTGEDEIKGIFIQKENRILIAGNFRNSIKWGNRNVESNGKQDGFIAIITDTGNCIALDAYGGVGNDSIDSIQGNNAQTYFAGSFSNEIKLGKKIFSTSGKRDSYIALLNNNGSLVIDAEQTGGVGEDVIKFTGSSMVGHLLTTGISSGVIGSDGLISTVSSTSSNSYVCLFGSTQFSPVLSPAPKTSILTSNMYHFEFESGPWPIGAKLSLNITQKPNWLNIELFDDGRGLVWGQSPTSEGSEERVRFDINSTGLSGLTSEWEIQILDISTAFSIVGNPVSRSTQLDQYRSEFTLSGSSLDNILIVPLNLPVWLSLNRDSRSSFVIEGTPLENDAGVFPIQILARKFFDQNSSYQEILEYSLVIQNKMLQSATSTNLGDWKTNWVGYFSTFDNSWSYHEDFLWVYWGAGSQADNVWFWTEKWGWLWTSSEHWDASKGEGYLYNSLNAEWMFFRRKQETLPSTVYLYSSAKWTTFQ